MVCLAALTAGAQSTNKVASGTKQKTSTDEGAASKSAHPFRGKLAAVDKTAKTITIGKSVYLITSETKIKKAGQPATLADGVIGEPASGYAKPTADGKMWASSLNFGPKPASTTASAKSKKN